MFQGACARGDLRGVNFVRQNSSAHVHNLRGVNFVRQNSSAHVHTRYFPHHPKLTKIKVVG